MLFLRALLAFVALPGVVAFALPALLLDPRPWARPFLAAGLVANTHAGATFGSRRFRLPESRVHVVWNGIARQVAACAPALRMAAPTNWDMQ